MAKTVETTPDPLVELYKRLKLSGATDTMMHRIVKRLTQRGVDVTTL